MERNVDLDGGAASDAGAPELSTPAETNRYPTEPAAAIEAEAVGVPASEPKRQNVYRCVGSGVGDAVAFRALHAAPRWVAWRTELDAGRRIKVPYSARGHAGRASTTNPATWGTLAEAAARAGRLPAIDGLPAGVGIVLGGGDAPAVGGVDLDSCLAADGTLAPWAAAIVDRLGAYAEVSPSGTGLKLFFTYDPADLPALRAELGDKTGRKWAWPGGEHSAAIEVYLTGRYFTVTDRHRPGSPDEVGPIGSAKMRWLAEEAAPAFLAAGPGGAPGNSGERQPGGSRQPGQASVGAPTGDGGGRARSAGRQRDGSRSGAAFRLAARLRRDGRVGSVEELRAALLADRETADWCREKGDAHGQRELKRLWEHTSPEALTPELAELIAEFNDHYMVVKQAGKTRICELATDQALGRTAYHMSSFPDFHNAYLNRTVQVGTNAKGKAVYEKAARAWLEHPGRRQYLGGLIFDPTGEHANRDTYNLWRGFAVEPQPGSWRLLREHTRNVICRGNEEHFDYVMGWLARLVQRPGEQGEVALVLKGAEGTGKGMLLRAVMRLLGQHALQISNARHLVGNFNAHLRDCVFLFADEAFYAGDKQHVGVLKSLITEPHLTIEPKGENVFQTPNYLHVAMASNEDWVVPASLEARRFFVLNVGNDRIGHQEYFGAIQEELENGGHGAMLHDLLAHDLTGFNVRQFPRTAELGEQQKQTMDTTHKWWLDVLQRGYVYESKWGLSESFHEWKPEVTTELLFRSYEAYASKVRERHPMSREALGKFMREKAGGRYTKGRNVIVGEELKRIPGDDGYTVTQGTPVIKDRAPGYHLGTLAQARAVFQLATVLPVDWEDPPEDLFEAAGAPDAAVCPAGTDGEG